MSQATLHTALSTCLYCQRSLFFPLIRPYLRSQATSNQPQARPSSRVARKLRSRKQNVKPASQLRILGKPSSSIRRVPGRLVRRTLSTPAQPVAGHVTNVAETTVLQTEIPLAKSNQTPSVEAQDPPVDKSHYEQLRVPSFELQEIPVEMPPVPRLAHGIDRSLFNHGVNQLRDLHSRVYNFDPAIEHIPPVNHVDFETLKGFTPSSEDPALIRICKENNKKYAGSTSSLTMLFRHLHYCLSAWRPLDLRNVTPKINSLSKQPTKVQRLPSSVLLKWKDGIYTIDADKDLDTPNVLGMMGRYLEALLTLDTPAFERHLKGNPDPADPNEPSFPDAHHYSSASNLLIRSQLDAYDPRLPGTGIFDLKTRATLPIRHRSGSFQDYTGYELSSLHGHEESYEREFADIVRTVLLKYSLQARMGRMDGILLAYHNIVRIYGFQYLSISEMDTCIHGQSDRTLGDAEFIYSTHLLNAILDKITEEFPKQTLRLVFESVQNEKAPHMRIYAEPITDEEIQARQAEAQREIEEWERVVRETGLPPAVEEKEVTSEAASDTDLKPAPSDESALDSEAEDLNSAPQIEPETPGRQVFLMTLKTLSTVIGKDVTRPENITDPSHWKVYYQLVPSKGTGHTMACYNRMEKFRKSILRKTRDNGYFDRYLRLLILRGQAWRERRDEIDAHDEERRGGVLTWNRTEPVKREDFAQT